MQMLHSFKEINTRAMSFIETHTIIPINYALPEQSKTHTASPYLPAQAMHQAKRRCLAEKRQRAALFEDFYRLKHSKNPRTKAA